MTTVGFALFVSFLLLLDLPRLGTALPGWLSRAYRREVPLLLNHLDELWEGFLKGEVIVGGLQAITAFIVFTILGVPGALFLAILDGTLGMIPSIGGIIAGIPVAIVCLFLGSSRFPDMSNVTFTILVFLINGILSQIIFTVVSPMIMSKKVNLPTLVIIIGVTIGLSLGGILGALLVVPLMGSIRLIFTYILSKLSDREPFPDEELPETPVHGFFSQIYENKAREEQQAPDEPA
jgi:predicted PurR-regulated permease PerM